MTSSHRPVRLGWAWASLVVVLILLIVAGRGVFSGDGPGLELRSSDSENRSADVAPPELEGLAGAAVPRATDVRRRPGASVATPAVIAPALSEPVSAPSSGASSSPGGTPVVLSGTLVLIDEEGLSHSRVGGTMNLILWTRSTQGTYQQVSVTDGTWTTEVPTGVRLEGGTARLDGRLALVELEKTLVPEGRTLALRARPIRPSTVRVIEEATGHRVSRFDVVRRREWVSHERDLVHPGPAEVWEVLESSTDSLFQFPESPAEERTYWIHAEGYAWSQVAIDHRVGGARTVRLQPSGSLQVSISNPDPRRAVIIRLRNPTARSGPPVLELQPTALGTCQVDDLAPGDYLVSAERGHWRNRHAARLAQATVEIRSGARSTLSLTLEQRETGLPMPLAGTLVIPGTWNLRSPPVLLISGSSGTSAAAEPIRILTRRADGASGTEWSWDAGEVLPGRYSAQVSLASAPGVWIAFRVEIPSTGIGAVRFLMPEPADVSLELIDETSGAVLDALSIEWAVRISDGASAGSSDPVVRAAGDRRFSFRAPVGTLLVEPLNPRLGGVTPGPTVLRPGRNAIQLRLKSAHVIAVTCRHAGVAIPIGSSARVIARQGSGSGRYEGMLQDGATVFITVPGPGRYVLSAENLTGYELISPLHVVVQEAGLTEVELELRPTR